MYGIAYSAIDTRSPSACPQRRSIPIDSKQVEAVMGADGNSASELLQLLYAFINSDAYT